MTIEERETGSLIASDKVDGTDVYGTGDEKIGSIERLMINKQSGKVTYAILAFGGFLGIGEDHYPLPWESLTYDTALEGYRTNVSKVQLEKAPRYAAESDWDWSDPARGRQISDYYGMAYPV